jgi:hypothetical protein
MSDDVSLLGAAVAIKRQVNRLALELAQYQLSPRGRARREADLAALSAVLAVLKPPRRAALCAPLDDVQEVQEGL